MSSISSILDKLTQWLPKNLEDKETKGRWVVLKEYNKGEYEVKWITHDTASKELIEGNKALQVVFERMQKELQKIGKEIPKTLNTEDQQALEEKLEELEQAISLKRENYNKAHGRIYKFFSKLFHGFRSVDETAQDLLSQIDTIQEKLFPEEVQALSSTRSDLEGGPEFPLRNPIEIHYSEEYNPVKNDSDLQVLKNFYILVKKSPSLVKLGITLQDFSKGFNENSREDQVNEIIHNLLEIKDRIYTLDLSSSSPIKLEKLPAEIGLFTNLRALRISDHNLSYISPALGDLQSLHFLILSRIHLEQLPESIQRLNNLRELYLLECNLQVIPEWIGNLKHLEKLDLKGNRQLTNLPQQITDCTKLENIVISEDQTELNEFLYTLYWAPESEFASGVEPTIKPTKSPRISMYTGLIDVWEDEQGLGLEKIFPLEDEESREIPPGVPPAKELSREEIETKKKELAIEAHYTSDYNPLENKNDLKILKDFYSLLKDKCGLDNLPEDFEQLSDLNQVITIRNNLNKVKDNVTYLSLYSKEFYKIPAEIELFTQLVVLNINSGKTLAFIPQTIGNLKNLKALDLSNNNLTHLPIEIKNLTNLEKLDLTINRLNSIPEFIKELSNLKELHLSNNQLSGDLPEWIQNLRLETLNLRFNKFEQVPKHLPSSLKKLFLSGNRDIQQLPDWIEEFKELQKLELDSMPNLKSLPETIKNCSKLTQIVVLSQGQEELALSISRLFGEKPRYEDKDKYRTYTIR